MKTITLTKGHITTVDDEDFEYLNQWKWYLSGRYVISGDKRKKMHRLIINAKEGELVDHIDRNPLNNTRENLRIVDACENTHNQRRRINTINNYKGTQFIKRLGLWQSRCRIYGHDYILGFYKSEIAAAYAYNKKAMELSDCVLLNELKIPTPKLEELLITDRSKIIPAEKQSEHKGVYWHRKSKAMRCGKWDAIIIFNGKRKYLGGFINETQAAEAYKTAEGVFGIDKTGNK